MKWVVNRAGIKEELDIKKIREKLIKACDNLEVNMIELESHIDAIYQEGITTKDSRNPYNTGCCYGKF